MSLPRLTGLIITFSRFQLACDAGLLVSDGEVIELAARPFAVLRALLDANGHLMSTAELGELIWNRADVGANAVQAHIAAIRRALQDERDLIVTVRGRGYRVAGEIRTSESPISKLGAGHRYPARRRAGNTRRNMASAAPTISSATFSDSGRLATIDTLLASRDTAASGAARDFSPFIGRHAELSELLAVVPSHRIITLSGASGMGKTRLAIEAANRLASHFLDGVCYVELAPLGHPERVISAIGAAVGYDPNPRLGEPSTLAARVGERRIVMIIDHCDHLAEAAAQTVSELIAHTPSLHVIVTSESPLFIEDELALPLAPLRVPPEPFDEASAGAAGKFAYDALELLFARLSQLLEAAGHDSRTLAPSTHTMFSAAARVCRRVEGIPLALELAAASIASRVTAGNDIETAIATFAATLDAHVMRHRGARRIALPRSAIPQTLVELSYTALEEPARAALRRLGVFPGAFSRDAALDVIGTLDRHLRALIDVGLVDALEFGRCLRLPQAVRRFALDALDRHHESDEAAARHAYHVAREVERFGCNPVSPRGLVAEQHHIDALRAALEWALSAGKDELCVDLLDHSESLWITFSLVDEYIDWLHLALARAEAAPMSRIREKMRLRAVLARALVRRRSTSEEAVRNWERTYELATACSDTPHRLRALYCLVISALDADEVERGTCLSAAFSEAATISHSQAAQLNARRLQGIVSAHRGELDKAVRLLSSPAEPINDPEVIHEANAMATSFGLSLHLVAYAILATTFWFSGQPHLAAPLRSRLLDSSDTCEPLSRSIALAVASALGVLDDDVGLVESCAASLVTSARLSGLRRWLRAGLDVQLWLDARRGDDNAARRLLGAVAKRFARAQIYLLDIAFVTTLLPKAAPEGAPEWCALLGAATNAALQRGSRTGKHWYWPEMRRIDASLRLAAGEDPDVVRALLLEALECAHRFGAKRIVFRIRMDLERLHASQKRRAPRFP